MQEVLLTPREVARRLSVSPRTVYLWIGEGRLPAVRLSQRCTRVPASAVDELASVSPRASDGSALARPDLSTVLWDVDPKTVDEDVHARFLIERILEGGDDEQVRWMLARYPREQVAAVVTSSRGLSHKSARAWEALLGALG
jgi:excisionase family DNA binding protein